MATKLSLVQVVKNFTPKDQNPAVYMKLIKQQVLGVDRQGRERPNEDLVYFLYVAHRSGLDPLARQIHAIYRRNSKLGKEVLTIQASIDGLRLVAQRSKLYGGQDDAVFDNEEAPRPNKATVTVYLLNPKTGKRIPVIASARWNEYVQRNNKGEITIMWAKMPYLMLAKCAEALALRKAFPAELSGIYTTDEMAQADNPLAELPKPTKKVDKKPQSQSELAKKLTKTRKKLKGKK